MAEVLVITGTETYQPGQTSPEGFAYSPFDGDQGYWSDGDTFIYVDVGQPLVITRTERFRIPDELLSVWTSP